MNPTAILALISSLYEQLSAAMQRIEELEAQAAKANGSDVKKEGVAVRG